MIINDAIWVGAKSELPACFFRKDFILPAISHAEILICGLGFFELYVNGRRVSEDCFQPVWSDYEARDCSELLYPNTDEMTHRIYFVKYDITQFLCCGNNTIRVLVGNGWYRQTERNIEGKLHYGNSLKLCFRLVCETVYGKWIVKTDGSEWQKKCFIQQNNLYFGETQDCSIANDGLLENDSYQEWNPVLRLEMPNAEFEVQRCPADQKIRQLVPVLIKREGLRAIYDAGENITGWAQLESELQQPEICIRYAEELDANSELDFSFSGGCAQIQMDKFLNPASKERLEPKFTWHGFRFFEVMGKAKPICCFVTHTEVLCNVTFSSNNKVLNWIFDAFLRTQKNNMHGGVPSDCPHRERLGYTGDGQLVCETAMLYFECGAFYEKWIQDIADCQDKKSGHVQHTAPFYGGGGGPGGWGSAIVVVPYQHYQRFGNKHVLEKYYPNMLAWVQSMRGFLQDGLIVREYSGGWCLGDWCAPEPIQLPEPFVNTYFFVKALKYLCYISEVLEQNCAQLLMLEKQCRNALQKLFLVEDCQQTKSPHWTRVQGAEAFALDIGIGHAALFQQMCKRYIELGAFDTGIFGTDVLLRVLAERKQDELMFQLMTSEKANSFGHMMRCGATTFWENWNGAESHDHPMFGACAKWLFLWLLGIRRPEKSVKEVIPCNDNEWLVSISPADLRETLSYSGEICEKESKVAISRVVANQSVVFNICLIRARAQFVFREDKRLLKSGEYKFVYSLI